MAIAVPSPLIPKLAEALGLDANRCRSIDLHLRTNDALTVSTVEYVDQQQADRVIKVMQSAEYVLVPKAEIERLRGRVVRLPWTRGDWAGTVDMIAYRGMVAEALDAAGVKWEMEDG